MKGDKPKKSERLDLSNYDDIHSNGSNGYESVDDGIKDHHNGYTVANGASEHQADYNTETVDSDIDEVVREEAQKPKS